MKHTWIKLTNSKKQCTRCGCINKKFTVERVNKNSYELKGIITDKVPECISNTKL